jgi:hypothetical protein
MECPKCQGLMITESLADGISNIKEWRCVNCGAILDAVIAQNQLRTSPRRRPSEAVPYRETFGASDFCKTLSLSKIIGSCCSTPGDGKKVNLIIQNLLNEGNTVELDFHGVKLVTSSFYRAAVRDLSYTFPEEFIQSHLSLSGLSERNTLDFEFLTR